MSLWLSYSLKWSLNVCNDIINMLLMWHHLATFGASTTFCERKTVGNTVKREISALTHQKNCNITFFFFFLCQTCFVFLHVYYYLICLSVSSHDINDFNLFKIHLVFNPQPNSHQPFQIKSKMIAQWWTITAVFFFCFFFLNTVWQSYIFHHNQLHRRTQCFEHDWETKRESV